jgi:hypothetical protein
MVLSLRSQRTMPLEVVMLVPLGVLFRPNIILVCPFVVLPIIMVQLDDFLALRSKIKIWSLLVLPLRVATLAVMVCNHILMGVSTQAIIVDIICRILQMTIGMALKAIPLRVPPILQMGPGVKVRPLPLRFTTTILAHIILDIHRLLRTLHSSIAVVLIQHPHADLQALNLLVRTTYTVWAKMSTWVKKGLWNTVQSMRKDERRLFLEVLDILPHCFRQFLMRFFLMPFIALARCPRFLLFLVLLHFLDTSSLPATLIFPYPHPAI